MSMSTKRRAPAKLAAPIVKANAKRPTKTTIDETKTAVSATQALQTAQVDTIEISSDEEAESDQDDLSDEEAEQSNKKTTEEEQEEGKEESAAQQINGKPTTKAGPAKDDDDDDDENEPASPSFGELLRGSTDAVDLTVMLKQHAAANGSAIPASRTAIVPPTHQSLVTVLSQALSTDDTDLLESCLLTKDLPTIKNTIERIDSALAGILLAKLAARLHRRPGRAGTLMTWVRWTLIAHGGALASQAKVVHSLGSLQKVLAERAKGLNSLLALKGKLDILEGQMELRRKMQNSKPTRQADDADHFDNNDDEGEGEEDAIYVEGEEHDTSANGTDGRRRAADNEEEEEEVLANGFPGDSEDDSENDEEDEDSADEAEEPLDEDEVNYDDVDESMGENEDEESDIDAAPPAKLQKVAKRFGKK